MSSFKKIHFLLEPEVAGVIFLFYRKGIFLCNTLTPPVVCLKISGGECLPLRRADNERPFRSFHRKGKLKPRINVKLLRLFIISIEALLGVAGNLDKPVLQIHLGHLAGKSFRIKCRRDLPHHLGLIREDRYDVHTPTNRF